MKIALSIITKGDEELENLKKCVSSFLPFVDGVFITANGKKTQKTKEYCNTLKLNYSYLKWDDDFAKQRNYNFSQIRGFDWIVWADSDDMLVGGEYLREIAETSLKNDFDCVFFTYYYGCIFDGEPSFNNIKHVDLIQKRERLLKPNVFKWVGRLHETPIPVENYTPRYTYVEYSEKYPILWLHTEVERDPNTKKNIERMQRNKRILEKQLDEERRSKNGADPRTLLYLMKIYAELQDKNLWVKCLEMGGEYLQKSGWDEERAVCLNIMSRCYSFLGQEDKARDMLLLSLKEYPYSVLTYLYLARVYFNLGDYGKMEHWLKTALSIDEKNISQMNNELEKKILASELTLKLQYLVKKDIRKALKSAEYLLSISPTDEVRATYEKMKELTELDLACENTHKLIKYLEKTNKEERIVPLLLALPDEIKNLEFAFYYYNKYKKPRVWRQNEVCYYAYLGEHFEKWSPNSLKTGIGGSETAVIKLSREWVKKGYQVVVYADVDKEGVYDGVLWLPAYKFNVRDRFNIFIQWRSSSLAGKIKAKMFLVDLHDLYSPLSINWDGVDYVMVKSKYHRSLASYIPDYKFKIISNGV